LDAQRSQPISLGGRISSIDVLRGVAILGILLMNIVCFSMVLAAYTNPAVYNDLSGADWWTWLMLHLFVDQKFMTMFSVLFGAGVCIFMERATAKSHSAWKLQASRMGWLLVIGLIHAYLIWYGDILVSYAVAGMAIALVRSWKPTTLFVVGIVVMLFIPLLFNAVVYLTVPFWPEDAIVQFQNTLNLDSNENMAEIAAYTGSWLDQLSHRIPMSLIMHFFIVPIYIFWHVAGLMLMGMAAYKWGILSATRSVKFYGMMIAGGLVIGLPLVGAGVWFNTKSGWDPIRGMFLDGTWNLVGGPFVAAAWIGLVMLICKRGVLPHIRTALASVGRMALTNYIGQSVICTLLFYGHGFGWFGQFERVELLYVVVAVWVFQIVFSILWLRSFRFGPLEWAWRTATYMRFQTLRQRDH
jgi:uncharacterized protein